MQYTTNAFRVSQGLVPRRAHPCFSRQSKAKSSSINNKDPKPNRIKIGKLSALKDMPAEIFYMIVGWLLPLDLIHMARTSKFFRTMLMSRKNECLWKAARRNVPGLPDCPQTLSEPRYAAFLFDQYCFACGIERSMNMDYNLALRLCAPCYTANIVSGTALEPEGLSDTDSKKCCWYAFVAGSCDSIRRPPARSGDPARNHEYNEYYIVEVNAVRAEITRLVATGDTVAVRTFLKERVEYVRQRQTHGAAVAEWRRQTLCNKHEQAESTKAERSGAIKEKLLELGYSEDQFPTNNPAWDKILNQPTKLNPRIWKTARPKLEALIEQEQQDRLQAAFEARLKERQAEFAPYYDFFITTAPEAERPFMPNLHDASALPCIAALLSAHNAEMPVTLGRLTPIQSRLRDEARQYMAQAKRDLVEMLHVECLNNVYKKQPMPAYNAAQIDAELAKASTLFECHHCPMKAFLSARDICAHWQAEHSHLKWNDNWPPNEHEDRRRRRSDWPKKLPWISAMGRRDKRAKDALVALGFNEDVSQTELDGLVRTRRLVCACDDPRLPPPHESSWGILLSHVFEEQAWFDRGVRAMSHYFGSQPGDSIRDNHRPIEACLTLLSSGEELMYPDYKLPQEAADEIAAIMAAEQHPPACKVCHNLTRDTWRFRSELWMPRDVDILAHHMQTKHCKRLTKDLLLFRSFPM